MRLKRLDVMGFKSFADRLDLDFVDGVSAVVGPNGSGKSNIADAIRWVLGEQNAKNLRGAKMEDVIFSGSATRKAVNFAAVTLTLDNQDGYFPMEFTEIAITRRVFRSGDSEYLINNKPCRLKDITELFMDSGLGKEAYSIIGQGRIEEILSTRSEDRRGIFEEAAGIVKFKARKKEAQKKMADAETNMTRVKDILAEIGAQMEPLEADAKKEKIYRERLEEATYWQTVLLVGEIDQLLNRRERLSRELAGLQEGVNEIDQQLQTHEGQMKESKEAADRFDQTMQQVADALLEATKFVEQSEADRRVTFERQENALKRADAIRLSFDRILAEQEETNRELEQTQGTLTTLQQEYETAKAGLASELAALDATGNLSTMTQEVQTLRSELFEAMRYQATQRNEEKNGLVQLEQLESKAQRMHSECEKNEQAWQEASSLKATLEKACEAIALEIAEVKEQQEQLRTQREQEEQAFSVLLQQERAVEQRVHSARSRLKTLQDLQEDREGFASGPKSVLQAHQKGRLPGIEGAIADLLVVQKDHEIAMETALGGAMQQIVVKTEGDARKAIDYLKKNQLGRATFLPMQTIKGRRLSPHELQMVKSAKGFVGIAADLVTIDSRYRPIFDNLLGSIIIATNLIEASALASVLQHRIRVVTLEGDVVNPGGSMTGGATARKGVGLLGRTREIEQLVQDVQQLDQELQLITLQKEQLSAKHVEQAKIATEVDRQWQSLLAKEQDKKHELMRVSLSLQNLTQQRDIWIIEREAMAQDKADLLVKHEFCQANVTQAQEQVSRLEQAIADLEAKMKAVAEVQSDQQDRITLLRVEVGQKEQAMIGAKQLLQKISKDQTDLHHEMETMLRDQQLVAQQIAQLRDELQQCDERCQQAETNRALKMAELEGMREQRETLIRVVDQAESRVTRLRQEVQKAQNAMHENEIARNRLEVELQTKVDSLRDDFHLGIELAREKYAVGSDLTEVRAKATRLRKSLADFEQVRYGAIEEFERLQERYHFLQSEETDLELARTQLLELIAAIEKEMEVRFLDVFEQVREHFQCVFVSLFGGGKADILLENPMFPLTSGIEIVAEPPGKKMQTLSLLSGGERALTALSLLFAILSVRPVPFCVLDEVEAALDEANVSRFASYLKEFSQQTQFIVITHRRGTMEAADVLYGVTMQEMGVSKLVSVRVTDEDAVRV